MNDFRSKENQIEASWMKAYFVKEVKGVIGHAEWYAYNLKGVMPTGPKGEFADILFEEGPIKLPGNRRNKT